eukprot:1431869-Pleurochrysis_carterae.AAC.2
MRGFLHCAPFRARVRNTADSSFLCRMRTRAARVPRRPQQLQPHACNYSHTREVLTSAPAFFRPDRCMEQICCAGPPIAARAAVLWVCMQTGRELALEIEPGTFLVANAGALLSTVQVRPPPAKSRLPPESFVRYVRSGKACAASA